MFIQPKALFVAAWEQLNSPAIKYRVESGYPPTRLIHVRARVTWSRAAMKEHRITKFVVELFSPRIHRSEEKQDREVPSLTDRQIAFHSGTRESGRFTVEEAENLYAKSKAR